MKVEEKKIVTVGQMTKELIGGFFLNGIVIGIIYSIIYGLIMSKVETNNYTIIIIITLILQAISIIAIWKLNVQERFKKKTILKKDSKLLIRNLIIFTVVIWVISAIYAYNKANNAFEEEIENSPEIQYQERFIEMLYDEDKKAEYYIQKQKVIDEAKSELNTYIAFLEIGILVIYLGSMLIVKKDINKKALEGN